MVRILNHLGVMHRLQIQICVQKLVQENEDPLVIPFLLHLSSSSDLMASTLVLVASQLLSENFAEKIGNLLPTWHAQDLIKDDTFLKLTVGILLKNGKFSLVKSLIDFAGEDSNLSRDVVNGSRSILDLLLGN